MILMKIDIISNVDAAADMGNGGRGRGKACLL